MALFWKRQERDDEFYKEDAGGLPPEQKERLYDGKQLERPVAPAGTKIEAAPFKPAASPASPTPPAGVPLKPTITFAPPGGTISDQKPSTGFFSGSATPPPIVPPPSGTGLFGRFRSALRDRLQKTRNEFVGKIREVIKAAGKVDDQLIDRIEEILIQADVGAETTMRIVAEMKEFEARGSRPDELMASFKSQLQDIIGTTTHSLTPAGKHPYVVLVVGVNGVGKTTTIGKLASEYKAKGLKTMIVAGDTFRAAAIDQLKIWADRTSSGFVSKGMGADPAGTAFDGVAKAMNENYDVVLIDTAGRLHTKAPLMEELKKIVRVTSKQLPAAPHDTILVLNATTGENAIQQSTVFTESIPVSGIVMTNLDGTAKGGVLIGVCNLFKIPIVKIGVGEGIEDLRDFNPTDFVNALFQE